MDQLQDFADQGVQQQPSKNRSIIRRLIVWVREILAILFWAYAITKLFIFDIDIFLIANLAPNYIWLINYKFFILIGILAVIFLVTKNRHILLWSLFICFYPVILFLWRIPVLVFKKKSWNLVFAFVDSVVSFFKSSKSMFIVTAIFLISTAIIFVASNSVLLWVSLVALLVIHLWAYVQRMILVFKPSGVHQVYNRVFSFLGDMARFRSSGTGTVATELVLSEKELELSLGNMDETQIQKWTTGVQWLVLFNRICLFVARKIKSYQDSKFNIISSVFGIMMLVLYTVFLFALVNFGLFKISKNYFEFTVNPTFFNFIYYSFNNFIFNIIPEIIAKAPIAQVVSMLESFFALFLAVIFVSLVLSLRSQREVDELNNVIEYLTEEGIKAEGYLKTRYKLNNIQEAMQILNELNSFFVDLMYQITDTIGD
jgi:hypothetical protein